MKIIFSLALLFTALGSVCAGPVYEPLAAFEAGPRRPGPGKLLLHTDGYFYGTSPLGGAHGAGTVYRVSPVGVLTVLAHFTGTSGHYPQGHLASDGNGFLWGVTTTEPGGFTVGSIFKISLNTGTITTVRTLGGASGTHPYSGLVSDGNGSFWGTTTAGGANGYGTVYKIDIATGVLTTVSSFAGGADGGGASAGLVGDGNGFLWGTTRGDAPFGVASTVFKVNVATGMRTIVVTLTGSGESGTGSGPCGELASDGAGCFWGTASGGGANGHGTIFKVNQATGELTRVVSFTGTGGSAPGAMPLAGLVRDSNGLLWGTTSTETGQYGMGNLFRINAMTGVLTTLVVFNGPNGTSPKAELVSDGNGSFWSTTAFGNSGEGNGGQGEGTVFKVNVDTGVLTTMADCVNVGPVQGTSPQAGLVSDASGVLWGSTEYGGTNGWGTIFKYLPDTEALTKVVYFTGETGSTKGTSPQGKLAADGNGFFWGTTFGNVGVPGTSGYDRGTIFKVSQNTGLLTTVQHFTGIGDVPGFGPVAGLVSDGNGFLWGSTRSGSNFSSGTIFKVDASTGVLTTVVEFTGSSGPAIGARPFGELISDGNGFFWGTTEQGGANALGTVFKLNKSTGVLTSVVSFTGTAGPASGAYPKAGLVSDGNGFFWGTTYFGGTADKGTVFKLQASTGILTTLVSFTGVSGAAPGSYPLAGLARDGSGNFWGTTRDGGTPLLGTIFKVTPAGAFTNAFSFTGLAGLVPGKAPGFGSLLPHSDGHMYGTTSEGGRTPAGHPAGHGQIFRLRFGPTPVTQPATPVAITTATLRGTVNPNGVVTTASFEWGTDPLLATFATVSAGTTSASTSPIAVSGSLTGLAGGNTYYFRVVGVNAENAQPQRGLIVSFSTAPTPIQQWKATYLGDAYAPDLDDPDGDGNCTLAEYGLNLLPQTPNGSPHAATRFDYPEGHRLRVFVQRNPAHNDVIVEVQAASHVAGPWSALATSTLGAPFSGPGYVGGDSATPGVKTVEIRDTVNIPDVPSRFVRVRVDH